MAIQFVNNVDFNANQAQSIRIENLATDPSTELVIGRIIFNTSADTLKQYVADAGSGSPGWVEVGSTTVKAGTGIGVTFAAGEATVRNTGLVTVADGTYIDLTKQGGGDNTELTADLSATGTADATKYLRGDNTWSAISGIYAWDISDGTNSETIVNGDTVTFTGGTNITTAYDDNNNTLTVDLDDSISLTGSLIVGTTGNFTGQVTIPQVPLSGTDAASKHYVDQAVTGALSYQGGYDAATNTPNLDNNPSPNPIKKGWTYTVTVAGLFFTEQVRVGDVLIAEQDAPTALADWTTVQNNVDLADLTTVGIGNVNPGGAIDVSYSNGTATVSVEDSTASNKGAVIVAAGTGISVAYASGTATVTNTQTNSANTFAVTITDTATVTHNLGTKDVIIQLYDVTTDETVYADVERASTNTATITFASTPTNSVRVLVQKIG